MVPCLGSLVQLCCREGGTLHTVSLACVGSARSVWTTLGVPPLTACAFPVCTAQAPGCSAGEQSKTGPGLHALPRSKLLRFSGTLQGHRLDCACVLCPSQVRAASATRCLVSTLSPGGPCVLITSLVLDARFPGVLCVSSCELISGCDPPGKCQPSRTPGGHG